jgi:hypothetical protein
MAVNKALLIRHVSITLVKQLLEHAVCTTLKHEIRRQNGTNTFQETAMTELQRWFCT